jgi:hypothetical protein
MTLIMKTRCAIMRCPECIRYYGIQGKYKYADEAALKAVEINRGKRREAVALNRETPMISRLHGVKPEMNKQIMTL